MNKSKVIWFSGGERQVSQSVCLNVWSVSLDGENLEEVKCFRYMGVDMVAERTTGAEESYMTGEWVKVLGALTNVWKAKSLSVRAKMGMFKGVVMHGCEV